MKRIGLNLPDEVHAWLAKQAELNRRSLQAQILWYFEQMQRNPVVHSVVQGSMILPKEIKS